jgi:TRAP-type C4-dicarboxylate transport system permease small subunit
MPEIALKFLEITARAAGFPDPKTIPEIIGAIINSFLSLLGVIFLCLIIYGGFLWMTSGGNETKVYRAKEVLRNAIIGLIIIMASYSITSFVIKTLIDVS